MSLLPVCRVWENNKLCGKDARHSKFAVSGKVVLLVDVCGEHMWEIERPKNQ